MFSPISWLGGYVFASIAGAFIIVRILQAVAGSFLEMDFRKQSKR